MKNSFYGITGKVLTLLLSFASRTAFIYVLGKYYLGIDGLYSDLLSLLSFAGLGFGSAFTYALYRPVAEGNEAKVLQLMNYYKKIYRIVALIVAVLGCCLIPFLPYIVENTVGITDFELRLYFGIFLINTVATYFVSYKSGYLNAIQKTYIFNNLETATTLLTIVLQIIVVLISRNFLAYLLTNTTVLLLSRIVIALWLNKKYPLVRGNANEALPAEERRGIFREVKGLAVHQFANIAVHATDSIIISVVPALGVALVGLVSNYNMLINGVIAMVAIVFNSVIPGFGNLAATESKDSFRKVFFEVNFASFWVYGFCVICFFVLIPPFIELWIGPDYLIDTPSFVLILVNCYLQGMCAAFNNARIAKGNFNRDKWWALLQAIVNLGVSVVGAIHLGLVGVFLGTVLSRMVFVIARPISMYRYCFERSSLEYFAYLGKYTTYVVVAGVATALLASQVLNDVTWGSFVLALAICLVIPNAIFFLFSFRGFEIKELAKRIKLMMNH